MALLRTVAFAAPIMALPQATTTGPSTPASTTSNLFVLKANVSEPSDALASPFSGDHIHNIDVAQVWKGSAFENETQWADGCQYRAGFADQYPYWEPLYSYLNDTGSGLITLGITNNGDGYHVATKDEADSSSRRAVGIGKATCISSFSTGFSIVANNDGIATLQYDDGEGFGSWYACSDSGAFIYGPGLFYRGPGETHPDGCADLNLIPQCAATSTATGSPDSGVLEATCYADASSVDS